MEEIILKYNSDKTLSFSTKSCAILWANWTWKSSLVKHFNDLNKNKDIHFIRAQRNLNINQWEYRAMQDDSLEKLLSSYSLPKVWNDLSEVHLWNEIVKNYHNNIIQNDFNKNIEKLFRDDTNLHANASRKWLVRPITKAEKIFTIWNSIFINKSIEIDEDWKIKIVFSKSKTEVSKYEIENLSDWERSALYLITKCIYAPENWIIIVDEWETHLNSALLHDLWDNIEDARSDCRFIYISHNIDFITSRNDCTKFWIKNFNHPWDWDIEEIENDNLPEELLLQIIWSKKEKILFVESKENKDKLFYQKIYNDFKIIPLDSCENVINFTKVLNQTSQNYHKKYFWLIDRDFRSEESIESLKQNNIFSLPVAEFENLFFKENIIKFIFNYLWKQTEFDEKFWKLKESIFSLKSDLNFKKDFYKNFIHQKFNQDLESFTIWEAFEFKNDYLELNELWKNIENETDYDNFLKLLNAKWIKWKISNLNLWYWWEQYYKQILDIFNTEKKDEFKNIFLEFMPEIK